MYVFLLNYFSQQSMVDAAEECISLVPKHWLKPQLRELSWVVVSNILEIFTPKIGEDEPILTNIFQRGWNHQLVSVAHLPNKKSKHLRIYPSCLWCLSSSFLTTYLWFFIRRLGLVMGFFSGGLSSSRVALFFFLILKALRSVLTSAGNMVWMGNLVGPAARQPENLHRMRDHSPFRIRKQRFCQRLIEECWCWWPSTVF